MTKDHRYRHTYSIGERMKDTKGNGPGTAGYRFMVSCVIGKFIKPKWLKDESLNQGNKIRKGI